VGAAPVFCNFFARVTRFQTVFFAHMGCGAHAIATNKVLKKLIFFFQEVVNHVFVKVLISKWLPRSNLRIAITQSSAGISRV
jgi:hypothetical protein